MRARKQDTVVKSNILIHKRITGAKEQDLEDYSSKYIMTVYREKFQIGLLVRSALRLVDRKWT